MGDGLAMEVIVQKRRGESRKKRKGQLEFEREQRAERAVQSKKPLGLYKLSTGRVAAGVFQWKVQSGSGEITL
jgi:hypothetical protein